MGKQRVFEIVAGSYEEFLLGYRFSSKENKLVQTFAAHDHSASIRCVAVSGHYLASGGADDRIFVYDMRTRKEHCSLTHHNGTVNCLEFTENHTHLLSGSADGVLAIVRVGNWQVEKIWEQAHKGSAILDIAVHSSGKMALTLGANGTLCTWNLIKGRQAFIINLNSKCKDVKSLDKIRWAPDGIRFILYGGKYSEVWSIETGGVLKQIEHKEKVTSCLWLTEDEFLLGHENGQFSVVNGEYEISRQHQAHTCRVKGLSNYKKFIISVTSSGEIKVWNKKFEEIAKYDSDCRLTSLAIVPELDVKKEEDAEETEVIEDDNKIEEPEISQARVVLDYSDEEPDNQAEEKISKKKRRQKLQPKDDAENKERKKKLKTKH